MTILGRSIELAGLRCSACQATLRIHIVITHRLFTCPDVGILDRDLMQAQAWAQAHRGPAELVPDPGPMGWHDRRYDTLS